MYSVPGGPGMNPAGFPHSEICGSLAICASPQLIAAYHVLHRLLTPRHPPNALSSLTEHSDARWQNFITRRPYSVVKDPNSTRRGHRRGCILIYRSRSGRRWAGHSGPSLVEIAGIEPATSGLQSRRSPN